MARGLLSAQDVEQNEQVDEEARREGSIVKIKMKNFITYDSVECCPGDSLNVVIGPNGTGKSTILSAIVLGLGGKPAHLGKPQANPQEFIKSHCQEAQITIELLRQKKNTVIQRTILGDGKSIWHLNGRQVNLKQVEEETKALNIQIDNLCQVLAQDRVQDFAKLNKQELLEATQKAVGKEGMSEVHTKLKNLQRDQNQLSVQIEGEKKRKEIEQGHVDRLKVDVEKMERRRGIEKEAEACKLKKAILEYKKKKDEVDRYKLMVKQKQEEIKKIDAKIEPFKAQIKQVEGKYNTVKNRHNGMDRRIRNQVTKVSNLRTQLENLREVILELEVSVEKQIKSFENQKHKEDALRQAISKLRNDIAAQETLSPEESARQAAQLRTAVEKYADEIKKINFVKLRLDNELMEIRLEMQNADRELKRLANQKELRMKNLQDIHHDAYQAARWVDTHRNMFEAPVYLPMIVELDVNPRFARYAENTIGFQDMIAIICESKNDVKTVVDNCRKRQDLRVNVLQAAPSNNSLPSPQMNVNDLKTRFPGFEGYMIDFIKGPSTLLHFLCHKKNLHNIPIALRDVDASDYFSLYFAGDLRKQQSKSRYSSNVMYLSDYIGQSRFFKSVGNDTDEEALKAKREAFAQRLAEKENSKSSLMQKDKEITEKREQSRHQQHKLEQAQTTLNTLRFHLSQKERDLSNLERSRPDPDKIRQEHAGKVKEAVLKLADAQEPFFRGLKELDGLLVEKETIEFEVQTAKALVTSTKRLCKVEEEMLSELKRELEGINNALADIRTEAQSQHRMIQSKNGGKGAGELWTENSDLFATLPTSLEELETHIEDKMAHAQMLGGRNDAEILRQYEGHVRELERLEKSIQDKETRASNLVTEMTTRENEWKTELNELVNTISTNFGKYFREMGCSGEVLLFTGNAEHDYDNYGLRIRVKFRANEELQDLNAHTQSGGERAVSTAIYMLALQGLTPAPFRLVDEINQGMDSKNERRVYELLLRSTSRPGTPQYFLLTPKLLKDMEYNPGTTVLCVMNSACAPNHKTWDINKFIALRQQLSHGGALQFQQNHDDDE